MGFQDIILLTGQLQIGFQDVTILLEGQLQIGLRMQ